MEFAQNPIFRFIFEKKLHFAFTYSMIVGGGIPVTYAVPSHPRSVFGSFSSFTAHICTNFSENHLKFGFKGRIYGQRQSFLPSHSLKKLQSHSETANQSTYAFKVDILYRDSKNVQLEHIKSSKQSNKTSLRYDSKRSLWCLFLVRKIA